MWPSKGCENQLPVAIFTDGFTFHKNKTWDDTLKREAIRQSGNFRVWSLTFKDVQDKFKSQGEYYTNTLLPEKMPSGTIMYNRMLKDGDERIKPSKVSTLELLAEYLENNNAEEIFKHHAEAFSWSLIDSSKKSNREAYDLWAEDITKLMHSVKVEYLKTFEETLFGTWIPRDINSSLSIYSGINHITKEPACPYVYAELNDENSKDDTYEKEWNGFWNLYNMMQFSTYFYGLTTSGVNRNIYDSLLNKEIAPKDDIVDKEEYDSKWDSIIQNIYDEKAIQFAKECAKNSISLPDEVGYELYENDLIIGECELLWKKYKVVYLTDNQIADSEEIFRNNGYIVVKTISEAMKYLGGDE